MNEPEHSAVTGTGRPEKPPWDAREARHSHTDEPKELIFRCLPDGILTFVSDSYCASLAKSPKELLGKPFYVLIPPEDRSTVLAKHRSLTPEKPAVTHEYRVVGPDGQVRWHQCSDIALFDREGNLLGYHSVGRDITEQLKTEEALRQSEQRLRFLMENMGDILWTMGLDLMTTYVSPSIVRMLGFTPEERYRQPLDEQITPESKELAFRLLSEELAIDGQPGVDPDRSVSIEMAYYHKNGSIVWAENVLRAIRASDGRIIALQGVSRDITKRRQMEAALRESVQRLQELSITDSLTGLYNQRHFYSTLAAEMTRTERYGRPLALIMIDIDDFKAFNDTYGHMEGDRVLEQLGKTIHNCTRRSDIACRYGGEEFVVVMPEADAAQAAVMAERIRTEFRSRFYNPRPGTELHKTISVGVAQYNQGEDSRSFISRADAYMYEAKRHGKDRVCHPPEASVSDAAEDGSPGSASVEEET